MAFNKVFNSEEVARLKKLIQEGDQVLYEVDALQTGLRETVKAIAEEMEIRPAILNKAIKIAHKANKLRYVDKIKPILGNSIELCRRIS